MPPLEPGEECSISLDAIACSRLHYVSGFLKAPLSEILSSLPMPEPGMSREDYYSALSIAAPIYKYFIPIFFRGFDRLLQVMSLEEVAPLLESTGEGRAGSGPRGFSMHFAGSDSNAPSSLVLELLLPRSDPSRIRIGVHATIAASLEEDLDPPTAERVARRAIAYAKRTKLYREVLDMIASSEGEYELRLEPCSEDSGDVELDSPLEVCMDIEVSAIPGLLLPLDLNPVLDLASYLARRLDRELEKIGT